MADGGGGVIWVGEPLTKWEKRSRAHARWRMEIWVGATADQESDGGRSWTKKKERRVVWLCLLIRTSR